MIEADLAVWSDSWLAHFSGIDTVVHLAGDAAPNGSWAAQSANADIALNVFEASAWAGVRRVVYASSSWVMAGYRAKDGQILPSSEPHPINGYGAAKLMGERIGHHFSEVRGLSVICLRVGLAEGLEASPPSRDTVHGLWGQQMWLSDRDMAQAFAKAIDAPHDLRFAVLNVTSANEQSRWDLEETRTVLGYSPADGHPRIEDRMLRNHEQAMRILIRQADDQLRALSASGA